MAGERECSTGFPMRAQRLVLASIGGIEATG
jgi:hypothetical protein